ncbi:hypothetical protein AB0M87_31055 [Streptomyces sp. NPDC051320]|uniref:hypothetical protein n=1 Tax=Streptomyces sp. NPDC051320 TaxID=3154644 RepID=UPI00343BF645
MSCPAVASGQRAVPPVQKDAVETKLHTAVCAGKVTLAAAQRAIVTDWPPHSAASISADPRSTCG